jgi:hypothetical protein
MLKTKSVPGQYIVKVKRSRRKEFAKFIIDTYKLKPEKDLDKLIDTTFPFVIDFAIKKLWICNSISSLACASSHGLIITEEEFKEKCL